MATKYTPEFKREAIRMMTELGLSVPEVSKKIGVNESQLYDWRKGPISKERRRSPDRVD